MAIDNVMLGAVRHYLCGNLAKATLLHGEISEGSKTLDSKIEGEQTIAEIIGKARELFLMHNAAMLNIPMPLDYSHKEGYVLSSQDKDFLSEAYRRAEITDWENFEELTKLRSMIDEYAPNNWNPPGLG